MTAQEKRITCWLPVPLIDSEKISYGKKLAELHKESDEVEEERKQSQERFKQRIGSIEGQIGHIAAILQNGFERREVDCLWRYLFETNGKELVRLDTGEILRTEAITVEELQLIVQMDQDKEIQGAVKEETTQQEPLLKPRTKPEPAYSRGSIAKET